MQLNTTKNSILQVCFNAILNLKWSKNKIFKKKCVNSKSHRCTVSETKLIISELNIMIKQKYHFWYLLNKDKLTAWITKYYSFITIAVLHYERVLIYMKGMCFLRTTLLAGVVRRGSRTICSFLNFNMRHVDNSRLFEVQTLNCTDLLSTFNLILSIFENCVGRWL